MEYLYYKVLFILREIVIGFLKFNIEQYGVCKGCTFGKYVKVVFLSSEYRFKGILDLVY